MSTLRLPEEAFGPLPEGAELWSSPNWFIISTLEFREGWSVLPPREHWVAAHVMSALSGRGAPGSLQWATVAVSYLLRLVDDRGGFTQTLRKLIEDGYLGSQGDGTSEWIVWPTGQLLKPTEAKGGNTQTPQNQPGQVLGTNTTAVTLPKTLPDTGAGLSALIGLPSLAVAGRAYLRSRR